MCDCGGGIQDESHVLFDCVKTEGVRQIFGVNNGIYQDIGELMNEMEVQSLVSFVNICMKFFK